jgi:uncharacterized damage-inducible protein DinB
MTLTEMFLAEVDREAELSRRVLERVPEGRNDWKPHEKSMALGYLANLVATMPGWIEMMIRTNEFDMRPNGAEWKPPAVPESKAELMQSLDASAAKAREALSATTDEHLMRNWRFLVAGNVVDDRPRHLCIRDSVLSHLAHHRGQLTVYLRLVGSLVPAVYGPSADEGIV